MRSGDADCWRQLLNKLGNGDVCPNSTCFLTEEEVPLFGLSLALAATYLEDELMKIKEEAFIFRKLLFMVVFLTISICGCPSKNEILPPTGPRLNPEDLKPGAIGPALEAALNSVLTSQEPSASATCPSQILKALDEIQNFECGAMRVPEFHNKGSVSKNNWALAYLKIFRDKDQKKPLLVIEQGGPGSSSMALAADYVSLIPELLNDFDILAVEQRGTRWTRPVAFCDEIIEYNIKTLSHPKSDETESEIHAKCLAKASEKVNLDSISSYQIAYDLVYSAQHFGYSTFSFFGVSYGTIVGQYLLKFHANSLEKTILDSPVVPGKNWKMDALRGLDDLARKNISNYIATQKNYGVRITVEQIAEDFASLAKSYDKLPLNLSYDYEGKSYPLKFDADHFRSILIRLFLMNYDPELLNVLKQAAASRATHPSRSKEIIAKFAQVFVDVESGNTDIMYEALICREFIVEPLAG